MFIQAFAGGEGVRGERGLGPGVDKTGTLTEGQSSPTVLCYAYLNASFQTELNNPLDEAVKAYARPAGVNISPEQKVDEIPYDVQAGEEVRPLDETRRAGIERRYSDWSGRGFVPLPAPLMLAMIGMTALYVVVTEIAKKYFYAHVDKA